MEFTVITEKKGVTRDGYEFEKIGDPSFTMVRFNLKPGQSIMAETGAMVTMSRTITIQTQKRAKGILKSIKVAALGRESFFINTFTAQGAPGELSLVGPGLGDIAGIDLTGMGGVILQKGAYLASSPTVNIDTNWQGFRGLMAEGGFFMLHATGTGTLWLSSFGALWERKLAPGEVLSVDNGHLVAWPDNIRYSIRRVGGLKSTLLSGEGFVVDLVGPGTILLQTRQLPAFVEALLPYLPTND